MSRGMWCIVALASSAAIACSSGHAGSLPTTSPTASATTPTAAMSSASVEDELVAAARTYYRLLKVAAEHPETDAAAFGAMVAADCACAQVVELLDRLARDHHRLLFAVTLGAPHLARREARQGTVFIRVKQSAGREVDDRGAVVRSLPATDGEYALDFVLADGRWRVTQITRTK